jgi:hypothetical protein
MEEADIEVEGVEEESEEDIIEDAADLEDDADAIGPDRRDGTIVAAAASRPSACTATCRRAPSPPSGRHRDTCPGHQASDRRSPAASGRFSRPATRARRWAG